MKINLFFYAFTFILLVIHVWKLLVIFSQKCVFMLKLYLCTFWIYSFSFVFILRYKYLSVKTISLYLNFIEYRAETNLLAKSTQSKTHVFK